MSQINQNGGQAVGFSTDLSDSKSVKSTFDQISQRFGQSTLAAAIFNLGGGFVKRPFLELTEEEFSTGVDVHWYVM